MYTYWMGNPKIIPLHTSESEAVKALWQDARVELQCSRVTRLLRSNDLPLARASEFEMRGEMGKARAWRTRFLPLSATSLIALGTSRGMHIGTSDVLEAELDKWLGNWVDAELPPLAPSRRRPKDLPYARSRAYREFAATLLRERINSSLPWLSRYLPDGPPDRPSFVRRYGWVHTAASVMSTARVFRIDDKRRPATADALVSFRIRNNKVWPELRYQYVDLYLRPILAQALLFEPEDDWELPVLERSLPLTEAAARSSGGRIFHTGLRRVDIEIAVFCEVLARILIDGRA